MCTSKTEFHLSNMLYVLDDDCMIAPLILHGVQFMYSYTVIKARGLGVGYVGPGRKQRRSKCIHGKGDNS